MKYLAIYFIILNSFSYLLVLIDKRKAIKNKYRISEKTFFIFSLFGGSFGVLIGMFQFHHKTKKLKFLIGIPILLLLNIAIVFLILEWGTTPFFFYFPLLLSMFSHRHNQYVHPLEYHELYELH